MSGNSSSRGEPPTSASCHGSLIIRCFEELFTSLITFPQIITFGKMASIVENPIPQLERRDSPSGYRFGPVPNNSNSSDGSLGPRGLARVSGSNKNMHSWKPHQSEGTTELSLREPCSSVREPCSSCREPCWSFSEPCWSFKEPCSSFREQCYAFTTYMPTYLHANMHVFTCLHANMR